MAKAYSPLAGKLRGRVGSTVFRNGQRSTVAAQYNPQVANPKTAAQAVQRAAFATATTAQAALLNIVDHSHEKVASRRENLQRFVSQNTELIRAGILADYNGGGSDIRPVLKGAKVIVPNPYVISEGSLLFPRTQWVSEGAEVGFPLLGTIPETISTEEQYAEALAAIGLLPGDQISLVAIIRDPNMVVASFEADGQRYDNFACEVIRARITFKTSLPTGFSGSLFGNGVFNPDLVAKREGQMLAEVTQVAGANWLGIETPIADGGQYQIGSAVLIRSQEDGSRVAYSNGRMITTAEEDVDVAWPMARSYMEGASVRLGAQPFLDNPVGAGSVNTPAASLALNVTGVPALIEGGSGSEIGVSATPKFSEMPTQITLRLGSNGATQTSKNIVGMSAGAAIGTGDFADVLLADAPVLNPEGQVSFSVMCENTGSIVLGGTIVANGVKATF